MSTREHWESVYRTKPSQSVSWYAAHLAESLRYIRAAAIGLDAAIIDVGGGASTLIDDLLADGYRDLTVLDVSAAALEVAKRRLGPAGEHVKWLTADILDAALPEHAYRLWHDRAVFHFLTADAQRQRYVAQVLHALQPGGSAIIATFGPEGPRKCSGLDVTRYCARELHAVFGARFELLDHSLDLHETPWRSTQQFLYCHLRRLPD